MTNDELVVRLKRFVNDERRITNEILKLINEVEKRMVHLEMGYSSLFDFLTTKIGYSSSAAWRRIEAARAIAVVPETEGKLQSGAVSLSNLAKAQKAIRHQEKNSGKKLNTEEKAAVFTAVENKTQDQADLELFKMLPDTKLPAHQERQKMLDDVFTKLTIIFENEGMEALAWAKDFFSHKVPDGTPGKVITQALIAFRDQITAAAAVKKRKNPVKAARMKCEYKDEKTGKVCGCTFQAESDHIIPKALGGSDEPSNRRPLCRKHNQFMATKELGQAWANAWRKKRGKVVLECMPQPASICFRPEDPIAVSFWALNGT